MLRRGKFSHDSFLVSLDCINSCGLKSRASQMLDDLPGARRIQPRDVRNGDQLNLQWRCVGADLPKVVSEFSGCLCGAFFFKIPSISFSIVRSPIVVCGCRVNGQAHAPA